MDGLFGNEESVAGFSFDESQIDFSFSSEEPQEVVEKKEEKDTIDDTVESPTDVVKTVEDVAAEEIDFSFSDNVEEGDEDGEEDNDDEEADDVVDTKKPTTKKAEKSSIIASFNLLKEKGIIDYEPEEGEELDEATANDLIEDGFDKAVEDRLGNMLGELDDDRKGIIKYIANGGDINKLSSLVGKNDSNSLDITKESDQEKLVRQHLIDTEFGDEDDIEAHIQFFKDRNTLEKQAKNIFDKKKVEDKGKQESLLKEQESQRKEQREKLRAFKTKLSQTMEDNKEINDITFTRKDKDLPDYINDASIAIEGSNKKITPFYKDLYEKMQDPKKMLLLAKIIRSDFDFSGIKNKVITKQTEEIEKDIQRVNKNTSAKKGSQKRLVDYL